MEMYAVEFETIWSNIWKVVVTFKYRKAKVLKQWKSGDGSSAYAL
jgi:hypothetical protein